MNPFAIVLMALQVGWQPSAGHVQIPIWPNAKPASDSEVAATVVDPAGHPKLVGGKPWTYVAQVSRPTMTVYSPRGDGGMRVADVQGDHARECYIDPRRRRQGELPP